MKKQLFLEDLKKIEIEILDYVAEFCNQNGLKYFIDSGTLLGAVRHKGFIPWDDDIDIVMPREDYDKFHKIFNNEGRFKLIGRHNTPEYVYAFSKVIDSHTELNEDLVKEIPGYGIYIDIFPLDGLPDDAKKRKKFQDKVWFLRTLATVAAREVKDNDSLKFKMLHWCVAKRKANYYLDKIDKLIRTHKLESSKYCSKLVVSSDKYRSTETALFDELINIEFEGKCYAAPKRYDEYLKIMYGDYMKLPPKDKQVSHHIFTAYQKQSEEQ